MNSRRIRRCFDEIEKKFKSCLAGLTSRAVQARKVGHEMARVVPGDGKGLVGASEFLETAEQPSQRF